MLDYILLLSKLLINYSYCDNGTEFKGELLDLLNSCRIPVVNRRAYCYGLGIGPGTGPSTGPGT
jgi:hypothetical protein